MTVLDFFVGTRMPENYHVYIETNTALNAMCFNSIVLIQLHVNKTHGINTYIYS